MKDIAKLISKWDEIDERVRTLDWAQRVFIGSKLAAHVLDLRTECGFDDAHDEIKARYLSVEGKLTVRDAADVLLTLKQLGASVLDFVEALEAAGSVSAALRLLNPRQQGTSRRSLPIDWQN